MEFAASWVEYEKNRIQEASQGSRTVLLSSQISLILIRWDFFILDSCVEFVRLFTFDFFIWNFLRIPWQRRDTRSEWFSAYCAQIIIYHCNKIIFIRIIFTGLSYCHIEFVGGVIYKFYILFSIINQPYLFRINSDSPWQCNNAKLNFCRKHFAYCVSESR